MYHHTSNLSVNSSTIDPRQAEQIHPYFGAHKNSANFPPHSSLINSFKNPKPETKNLDGWYPIIYTPEK